MLVIRNQGDDAGGLQLGLHPCGVPQDSMDVLRTVRLYEVPGEPVPSVCVRQIRQVLPIGPGGHESIVYRPAVAEIRRQPAPHHIVQAQDAAIQIELY